MGGALFAGLGNEQGDHALRWIYVTRRFAGFIENLGLTEAQLQDGTTKQAGVRSVLNRHYYGQADETANSMLVGSWGKQLRVRPGRDIDVLFVLPDHVFARFQQRTGNRQSQLLQEVKSVLAASYGDQTDMRGDGQAVVVRFVSMPVDVVPAFSLGNGQFWICDTENGGSYRVTDPWSEIAVLDQTDQVNRGAARHLVRMAKQWQRHCNVPLRSFMLERLVVEFIATWPYDRSFFWYDWLVRDFFAFLVGRAWGSIVMPGTGHVIGLGDAWLTRAQTAHRHALAACDYERANENILAGLSWQNIFGTMIAGAV